MMFNKIKKLGIIRSTFIEYADTIHDYIDEITNELIMTALNAVVLPVSEVTGIVAQYLTIIKLNDTINNVIVIFDKHKPALIGDTSDTVKSSIQIEYDKVALAYHAYNNNFRSIETQLINSAVTELIDVKHLIKSAKLHQTMFRAIPDTLHLYAALMQHIVDISDENISKKIMMMIDADKTYLMQHNVPVFHNIDVNIYKTNPSLNKFNLVPITKPMALKELMSILVPQSNGTVNMEKYAASNKTGFIVMKKIVYNTIIYDINNLMYSKRTNKSQLSGISNSVIDKFRNIIKSPKERKWDFSNTIIGDIKDMKNYYLLETLDGVLYSAVAPWLYKKYNIPKYLIMPLIKSINTVMTPTVSSIYQQLQQKKAVSNMFITKLVDYEELLLKSTEIDIMHIYNILYIKIMDGIKLNLDKQYNGGKLVKNNTDMNEIIHSEDINDIFYNTVLELYKVGTESTNISEYSAGEFNFNEIFASYINTVTWVAKRFMKEIHNKYNRSPLNNKVFAMTNTRTRVRAISDKLENVIKHGIYVTIPRDNNLYTELAYKYVLLNYT